MSVTHDQFTLERRYGHSSERAFSAFADPELKKQWFANPGNWPNAHWELDFRVGGSEVSSGGSPGGRFNEFRSRYHDIIENERIVYSYDLFHDHRLISVSLTTIEFFADGDGARVAFTEQGAFFDDPTAPAQREHGTGVLLDMYGRFLDGETR
ncbi:MAG TPA: SRPBCC domain-containing protein [Solirubrobacterales bacterium]|nr:SRPBCC domain-containing protein [Solirubrobacterales bacterium]